MFSQQHPELICSFVGGVTETIFTAELRNEEVMFQCGPGEIHDKRRNACVKVSTIE